jgi:DNA uptake protein ComE-like DNA-binding protein
MGNSWKDLFTFSRREQGGVAVLLTILAGLIILDPLIPRVVKRDVEDMKEFRQYAEELITGMERRDSALNRVKSTTNPMFKAEQERPTVSLFLQDPFTFDPNTASREMLIKTGLKEFVAENILRYRKKGGRFDSPGDIRKIYGMDPAWFNSVQPYIQIPEEPISTDAPEEKDSITATAVLEEKSAPLNEHIMIELNSADSAELTRCFGIGPSFARRIITYRNLLGGFYDKSQLMEVFGMDSVRFEGFEEQVYAEPSCISKMDLNNIEFKEMMRHPYFEYYLVKSIFNYKDGKKQIDSVAEIKDLPEIYPELYDRISPYLKVTGE